MVAMDNTKSLWSYCT